VVVLEEGKSRGVMVFLEIASDYMALFTVFEPAGNTRIDIVSWTFNQTILYESTNFDSKNYLVVSWLVGIYTYQLICF
jgi:hypothetical protein